MKKADLELAKKRFKFADDSEKNQRDRERDDLGFYEGEQQWSSEIKTLRAGQQAQGTMPAVPARPCLTINKIRDPIRRIQNDELQADLGMSIIPADDFGGDIDENEIELREGLARRIQRQSNAKDARMWAANRAAISGRGWYGITTRDVPADTMDQEIAYVRYYDQFSVLVDPTHEQPDGSDIEYAFVGRDVPLDIYREEYPSLADGKDNPLASENLSDDTWRAYADDAPQWVHQDGENRSVRVTEYWRYERERYELVAMSDGSVVRVDSLPKDVQKAIPKAARKERIVKKVKFSVIDGVNTLEETDWPGKYIPIIKVVGEEIHVFDQERRCEGLVRPSRDGQQAFNVMVSRAVESIGLSSLTPMMIAAGSIENFEEFWKSAAVRNWPYLPYNAIDPTTLQPLPPPQRQQGEPANIQAMAMMMQTFDQAIMATIGQASLADTHPDVRSGAMASTIIEEAARGTSNYLANLIRSMHYEGLIINDLLEPIYGNRPGRIVSMMSKSGKTDRVMVGQPFMPPAQPGAMPQAVPPPQPGMPPQPPPENAKTYTLTKDGSFNVAIEVNKYYETKQQEKVALLASLIEKSPEMFMPVFGDRFMELVGDDEMAKRAKAMLAPPIQAMLREGQAPDPRLGQATQMLEAATNEIQQLRADKHARIEQAGIKAMSDMATTEKDNETKLAIAESHDATAIAIAQMTSAIKQQAEQVKLLVAADKARQEQLRTVEAFMEERRLASDQQHEHDTITREQSHDIGMARLENRHAHEQIEHEAEAFPPSTNGSGE